VPKKLWLLAAVGWTLLVTLACLSSFGGFPKVGIPSADKYVHVIFHFVFTILWCFYFQSRRRYSNNVKIAFSIVLLSAVFGAAIEIAQEVFTTTRQADIMDLLANLSGAILAATVVTIYNWLFKKKYY